MVSRRGLGQAGPAGLGTGAVATRFGRALAREGSGRGQEPWSPPRVAGQGWRPGASQGMAKWPRLPVVGDLRGKGGESGASDRGSRRVSRGGVSDRGRRGPRRTGRSTGAGEGGTGEASTECSDPRLRADPRSGHHSPGAESHPNAARFAVLKVQMWPGSRGCRPRVSGAEGRL